MSLSDSKNTASNLDNARGLAMGGSKQPSGEDYELSLSEYHAKLRKWSRNIDRGYAWVVLVALWLLTCTALGPYRLYSLMFARVTADGVYTREEATMPVAAILTVENLVGPFVSLVAYRTSFSCCILIGTLALTLGNGLAGLSNSLSLDILLIGVVQGIGSAFIFIPFMEIINNYFVKYRNLAFGLALCGGTTSIFMLSPIFQWILNEYPWRYSYFGIAIVCSVGLLTVPFLKPNPKPQFEGLQIMNPSLQQAKTKLGYSPSLPGSCSISLSSFATSTSTFTRDTFKHLSLRVLTTYQSSMRMRPGPSPGLQRRPSIVSMNPYASSVGVERKISSRLDKQEAGGQNSHESVQDDGSFQLKIVKDILKTPAFHMIWYSEVLFFWVFSIYCLVLVDYGVDRQCTQQEAEFLLNYQSVGELVGRLVLSYLVDLQLLSNRHTIVIVLLIVACSLIIITLVSGYLWMALLTTIISSFSSLLYILLNGLLIDNLGERKVTLAYGMSSFFCGILMSFRPQLVGLFRDKLGSYDGLMLTLAASCMLGALLWMLEPLIRNSLSPKDKPTKASENHEVQ